MNRIQFLTFTVQFVVILGNLLTYAIIARVLISWFSMGSQRGRGKFSQAVFDATEPMMNLVRKIPHRIGMIDLSPIIALIGIDLIVSLLITLIRNLA